MVRHFRDAAGRDWQVSLTERSESGGRREQYLPEAFRSGWLTFESEGEKRRLAPVPPGWESLSDEALAALCATASTRPPRRGDLAEAPEPHPAVGGAEPLRPELRRVQERLAETLEEVCEVPAVEKLDTGELIRMEESLAIAADAAKEAVSLRRKLRAAGEGDGPEPRPEKNE